MTWQPIETAPKDGTGILLYSSEGIALAKWSHYWNTSSWVAISGDEECFTYDECHMEISNPTHWMPLPPPPAEEPQGGILKGISPEEFLKRENKYSPANMLNKKTY